MEIRSLRESDDRREFRSGDPDLDRFFLKYAGQNQFRHHIGVTYVAVESELMAGYVTVVPSELEAERMAPTSRKNLPRYPLPVLRLARLAVDESFRQRGVGRDLLRFVLQLALRMARELGCTGILVDAKPGAASYYLQYGFIPLETADMIPATTATPMFLAIGKIQAAAGHS